MSGASIPWLAHDASSLAVLELARKVAQTATTLLITGESGTGKDQLARLIHEQGPQHDAPYQKIDCASLPSELVESELFGHERGAFTGAVDRKLGRLELARNGAIVLDEVAALAPAVQSKLLRVLEERAFERLGGTETLRLEARIVALTNADLPRAVAAGRFREDLYFRLNVLTISVPPLRERRGDILPLANHLLARLAPVHGRVGASLTHEAVHALEAYKWPGNVFARGAEIGPDDLPENVRNAAGAAAQTAHLLSIEQLEREAIIATLEATHYKIAKAAEILGISRKTLLDKRKKFGLK
jgi:two-component system response regulator AtoC